MPCLGMQIPALPAYPLPQSSNQEETLCPQTPSPLGSWTPGREKKQAEKKKLKRSSVNWVLLPPPFSPVLSQRKKRRKKLRKR